MLAEEIVRRISSNYRVLHRMTQEDIITVITDYSEIHNKTPQQIALLLQVLFTTNIFTENFFLTALEYYEIYYRFTFLLDQHGQIIKML
jgi:hypothetical protein